MTCVELHARQSPEVNPLSGIRYLPLTAGSDRFVTPGNDPLDISAGQTGFSGTYEGRAAELTVGSTG